MTDAVATHDAATWLAAFVLPPLAVHRAAGGARLFGVTTLLTVLGFLPGMIAALVIVARGARTSGAIAA